MIFYSTAERGVLAEDLDSLGIKNRFAKSPDSKWGFVVQLRFLTSFIRANRIEVVFFPFTTGQSCGAVGRETPPPSGYPLPTSQ